MLCQTKLLEKFKFALACYLGKFTFDCSTVCSHLKVVLSSAMLVHLTVPLQRVLGQDDEIQDRSAHSKLKKDLMEHIWNKNGIC